MKNQRLKNFLILLAVTVIFCLLVCVIDRAAVGPNNTVVGWSHLNNWFHNLVGMNNLWYVITNLLGYFALLMCVGFGAIGALQLFTKKSLLKVDRNILALGVLYIVVIALYIIFEKAEINFRPVLIGKETSPEASFPSSHTMLAVVVFCSAPAVLRRYVPKNLIKPITYVLYALTVIMVVGRLLSGVHWLTDIIAGVLISATLLDLFFIALSYIKPKKKPQQ